MAAAGLEISAIVPTCNRPESLFRLLRSLERQDYPLREVLIVDSSDRPLDQARLLSSFPALPIIYRTSSPSVCAQRNLAIRRATSDYLLLCSDDIELPERYVSDLVLHMKADPAIGAITGLCLEPDADQAFTTAFPTISLKTLLWNFIFQLTVWADLRSLKSPDWFRPVFWFLQRYYERKGNTYTLAGWPLVTQTGTQAFRTSHFSMDGLIIRRDWLLHSPYDERLEPHGIGENYGVALNLPEEQAITVLKSVSFFHYKDPAGRLPMEESYFLRILALDYFMSRHPRFRQIHRIFLLWSLTGNLLAFFFRGRRTMAATTLKAIRILLFRKNPYRTTSSKGAAAMQEAAHVVQ